MRSADNPASALSITDIRGKLFMSRSLRGKILYFFCLIVASSFSAEASEMPPKSTSNLAVFREAANSHPGHIA